MCSIIPYSSLIYKEQRRFEPGKGSILYSSRPQHSPHMFIPYHELYSAEFHEAHAVTQ